jgi:hypothetical protein
MHVRFLTNHTSEDSARENALPFSTTTCMTDVVSHRLTYSRRYGSPLYRAPRTGDGQLVPAGLLTCGSDVFSDLPEDLAEIVSGLIRSRLAAYSCGGSHGIGADAPHRVPFSSTLGLRRESKPSRRAFKFKRDAVSMQAKSHAL